MFLSPPWIWRWRRWRLGYPASRVVVRTRRTGDQHHYDGEAYEGYEPPLKHQSSNSCWWNNSSSTPWKMPLSCSRLYTSRSMGVPTRCAISVFEVWPGRRIRALACSYVSKLFVGQYQMIVFAAVSVSPWLMHAGWATMTRGCSSF